MLFQENEYRSDFHRWYHEEYLNGESWKRRRNAVLAARDRRCELCGAPANTVHHLSYETVNANYPATDSVEPNEVLLAVCNNCHTRLHGEWQELADKYAARMDRVTDQMIDAGFAGMMEAIIPIVKEWHPKFEQFSGAALAAVMKNSRHKCNERVFWKLRDFYEYYGLMRCFDVKLRRNLGRLPDFGVNGKCSSFSVHRSKLLGKKRSKRPRTMEEFIKMMEERIDDEYARWKANFVRGADHEEKQPEDHTDRGAAEDRAVKPIQEIRG